MSKRRISEVWQHFVTSEDGPHKVSCKYCDTLVSRGPQHYPPQDLSNAGLWRHLERVHQDLWKEAKEKTNVAIEEKRRRQEEIIQKKKIYCLADKCSSATKQTTMLECFSAGTKWKKDSRNYVSNLTLLKSLSVLHMFIYMNYCISIFTHLSPTFFITEQCNPKIGDLGSRLHEPLHNHFKSPIQSVDIHFATKI